MAHEVESMFSVKITPWHGLGVVLPNCPSVKEAITCAGLDWTVDLAPLSTDAGSPVDHKATVRASDGKVLGVVGPDYTPLQNSEAFAFFAPFVDTKQATIETAGSLRGGRRVWVLAQLALDPVTIKPGDDVRKYVMLSNAHDGTSAVRVGFTPIRVVCANTLAMAHDSGKSALLRVQHRANVVDTLEAVRDAMNMANQRFESTAEQYRRLAAREVSADDLTRYVNMVFAPAKVAEQARKRSTGMVLASRAAEILEGELMEPAEALASRIVGKVRELFETGRGHELAGHNLWGAYNAITEYIGYERGANDDTRLEQAWFGAGAALNKRALDVGLQMAA